MCVCSQGPVTFAVADCARHIMDIRTMLDSPSARGTRRDRVAAPLCREHRLVRPRRHNTVAGTTKGATDAP